MSLALDLQTAAFLLIWMSCRMGSTAYKLSTEPGNHIFASLTKVSCHKRKRLLLPVPCLLGKHLFRLTLFGMCLDDDLARAGKTVGQN